MMIDDDTLKQLLGINDALFQLCSGSPTINPLLQLTTGG